MGGGVEREVAGDSPPGLDVIGQAGPTPSRVLTLRGLSPLVGAAVDGQSRGVDGGATTWITQPPGRMPS